MRHISYAAAAMLAAVAGVNVDAERDVYRRRRSAKASYRPYIFRQSEASKDFYRDRAIAKRERKAKILNGMADKGAIGKAERSAV